MIKDKAFEPIQQAVLELMEEHKEDWTKPFTDVMAKEMPYNYVTKKHYQGFNVFWLSMACHYKGYENNEWATWNQWFELGGGKKEKVDGKWKIIKPSTIQVKDKEKATRIYFWEIKQYEDKNSIDSNGDPEIKSRWFLKVWNVFNINQVNGIKAKPKVKKPIKFNVNDFSMVQDYVANTKAEIRTGGTAYYSPTLDYIQMPKMEAFNETKTSNAGENYYSTLLHELVHWTGHKDRCNRFNKKVDSYSKEYALEELVAETGSAMLCVLLGVTNSPRPDHAQYLNHWKNVIRDNPRAIYTAFSRSSKAIQFLDGLQKTKRKEVA